jgi:tRNA1(Val) A37 N6-methylase TrmN6
MSEPITEDTLLDGRVRLLQPAEGHRAGTDAVLLAAAAAADPGDTVVDMGAATGAVGLMIAARVPGVRLILVERDPELAELCRQNLILNHLDGQVAAADLLDSRARREAGLLSESADLVVTNPPFLEAGRARISPNARRAAAHALPEGGLGAWLGACAGLLKPKGQLAVIHRADRLAECLAGLPPSFGGIRLRLVHPQAGKSATRLLMTARKGSRAPLQVEAPLILHDETSRFTPEAEALHRGMAAAM